MASNCFVYMALQIILLLADQRQLCLCSALNITAPKDCPIGLVFTIEGI